MILHAAASQVLVIDVQECLAPAMSDAKTLVDTICRLGRAARELEIPVTLSEQYPKGIGATLAAVRGGCGNAAPVFDKVAFSCARDDRLLAHLTRVAREQNRPQLILCGIEAHVCVLQTALDFLASGVEVAVVADAIGSRAPDSKDLALRRLERAGAIVVTFEMVVFEWLGRAGTAEFKRLLPLIKS